MKILKVPFDDILFDKDDAAEVVNKACSRSPGAAVTGICSGKDRLFISLEANPAPTGRRYVFAPLDIKNDDEIAAEMTTRHYAGFTILGDFNINGKTWIFLAFDEKYGPVRKKKKRRA